MQISTGRFAGLRLILPAAAMIFASALWAGTKGPDAGQYAATDAAVYSFIDIAGAGGSASVLADTDDGAVLLSLPFLFQFYGHAYSTVCVSSNGLLTFVADSASCGAGVDFANADLSVAGPPGDVPAILPFWTDLTFQAPGAGAVYYQTFGTAGSRRFIVQWNNAYPQGSPNPVTFQVILSEGGNQILFQYKTVDLGSGNAASNGAQASIGIRDASGNTTNRQIAWSYDAAVLVNQTSLLFTGPASAGNPLLSVVQTPDAATVSAGSAIGFAVQVSNSSVAGTGTAAGTTLTDALPVGGSGWSISPAYSGTGTCSITGAVGSQTLSCAFGDMAPGASASVHVGSATSPSGCAVYTNTATASATNSNPVQGSAGVTVVCPSLSISKTHTGSFTQGQNNATYSVTVSNAATALPSSGMVTVTETVPTGLTLASMAGAGWTCTSGGTTCTRSDSLAAGASYPGITVTVNVAANATSPEVNQVSVSGGGSTAASASDSTTINTALVTPTISAAFSPASIMSGGASTLTLTVSNSNASALTGGAFTDTLANMSAVGGTVGGTCAGTTPGTLTAGQTSLSFTGITIPASGSCTVAFSVTSATVGSNANTPSGVTATQTTIAGSATGATLTVSTAGSSSTIAAGAVVAGPGGSFSLPVTLNLSSGVTVNSLAFGVQITPAGTAPAFTGTTLSFTKDGSIADAPIANPSGSNGISVMWGSLTTALSGTSAVGLVTGTIPVGAMPGQSYTVAITGPTAALGNNTIALSAGANGTLTVGYFVGDVYPYTGDTAADFGDRVLNILDLKYVLFAATNIGPPLPAACSDRFDAMDVYPLDTAARGGDGALDIRDLKYLLFRATNLDLTRPARTPRGGCASGQNATNAAQPGIEDTAMRRRPQAEGTLALGRPEASGPGQERAPVYLEATRDLVRIAVAFGIGDRQSELHFEPVAGLAPSLADDSQRGAVAVAWLEGIGARAGERLLLGYVVGPAGTAANWKVLGVTASELDGDREVRLLAPAAGLEQ